tara:strand:+ start:2694 stop:2906 length:213 start_codon:yes stop_codon:yes gene_type:complete
MNMEEPTKQVVDMLSFATVLGTISAILPPLSALFTIVWVGIRIWETDTVQKLAGQKRRRDAKGRFVKDDD